MAREPRQGRRPFSLTHGGPFHHLLARLGLCKPSGAIRCWWLGLSLWLPLALGELIRVAAGAPPDRSLFDLSIHVRLLFTLPVFLFAERLLDEGVVSAVNSIERGGFCDRASLERILEQAEHLRDARLVEAALLGVALVGGQLVLWGVFGAAGVVHGGAVVGGWTFPRVWYAILALPMVQFVMFRWLWRWAIWTRILVRLARLPLAPLMTHADNAGGLAALTRPVTGFSGFVLAVSAILSAAWGTAVLEGRTTIQALVPGLVTFLVVAIVVGLGPLFVFFGHLFRARRRALAQYGDFVREYTLRFHRKWIDPRSTGEELLGSPDMQSLNDLGQSFGVVSRSRPFVFGLRQILMVWASALLPMVPLYVSALSVEVVLKRIFATVLGGLPL